MNLKKILTDIENIQPEIFNQIGGRRELLQKAGRKAALASIPVALTTLMSNNASAKSTSANAIVTNLNYALELEYFAYNFYRSGNSTGGLIPSGDLPGFQAIESHRLAHLNYLIMAITGLSGTPFTPNHYTGNHFCPAAYDFTAGGAYSIYASGNYYLYLDLAQAFADLFVRAFIGIIPNISSNTALMTNLSQMQTTIARDAAHIRLARRYSATASENPKPWVTNDILISTMPVTATQAFYAGEANTVQQGVNITALSGITGTLSEAAATEAFDEPLDQPTVLSLIGPYLLP